MDVLYFQVGTNLQPWYTLGWVFGRSLHAILGHPEMGGVCAQMMGFSWGLLNQVTLQKSRRAAAWQHGLMHGRGVRYIE